jgi:hypothetical protein
MCNYYQCRGKLQKPGGKRNCNRLSITIYILFFIPEKIFWQNPSELSPNYGPDYYILTLYVA